MKEKNVMIMLGSILAAIVILGIFLVALFNQGFVEIKNEVINNGASVISQVASVNGTVSSMMQSIQDMLDKQDSLLAGYTVTYGKLDAKALQCDVTVSVTPKVFSPDMFVALYIGDQSALMILNGNAYSATVAVPITEVYENVSVTFEQGGISQSEVLPEVVNIGNQLLNGFNVEPRINNMSYSDNSMLYDGTVYYSFPEGFGEKIASVRTYAVKNGQEIWWMNVDNPKAEQEIPINFSFKTDLDESIPIVVEITGSSGLKYRRSASGYPDLDYAAIYDADGNEIMKINGSAILY